MYLIAAYRNLGLSEGPLADLASRRAGSFVVRGARVEGLRRDRATDTVRFAFEGHAGEVAAPAQLVMEFGGERVTALEYAVRVIERGDRLDLVVSPALDAPLLAFWIRIVAEGPAPTGPSRSRKEDGLFAMRGKAGEKAQRLAGRRLAEAGHTFTPDAVETPGHFVITWKGKRRRAPDLVCSGCGLHFEVKKRNRDRRFRTSHSDARPFGTENRRDGWQVFVFPDMSSRFVPNARLLDLMAEGRFKIDHDAYDSWAEFDGADVQAVDQAPRCAGSPANCGGAA